MVMKRRFSKTRGHEGKLAWWGEDQRLQAAACYVMLGSLRQVAMATGISLSQLKVWKTADWWKDLILQIRDEDVAQLDANIQKVVCKALKVVEDRLDGGDYQYDPKTGKPVRIPVKAQIALRVTTDLLARQEKIRSAPVRMEVEKTIDARLAKLADEFHRFAKGGTKTINMEPLVIPEEVLTPVQEAAIQAHLHPQSTPPAAISTSPSQFKWKSQQVEVDPIVTSNIS